jgi:hypothetical protein
MDCSNIDVLKEKLGFKPDILDHLPEDEKNILELTKGRSLEEIEKALALWDQQKRQEEQVDSEIWEPDIEPDKVEINIEDLIPEILSPPTLEGQVKTLVYAWNEESDTDNESDEDEPKLEIPDMQQKPPDISKDIGRWGEYYVFNALKLRLGNEATITETDYGYSISNNQIELKIYWLNIKNDNGKGYDFVIKQEDEEIEYIEVKTTTEDEETLIRISGTQWEFARKLFNKDEGDKYIIYRVFDAGQSNARIKKLKNPIKLWREGKLYAHPIHLRL